MAKTGIAIGILLIVIGLCWLILQEQNFIPAISTRYLT